MAVAIAVIVIASMLPPSRAALKVAKQSGIWETAATWLGGVPPAYGDDVLIGNGCVVTVQSTGSLTTYNNVTLGTGPPNGAAILCGGSGVCNSGSSMLPTWLTAADGPSSLGVNVITTYASLRGNLTLYSSNLIIATTRIDVGNDAAITFGSTPSGFFQPVLRSPMSLSIPIYHLSGTHRIDACPAVPAGVGRALIDLCSHDTHHAR